MESFMGTELVYNHWKLKVNDFEFILKEYNDEFYFK
jgi:hypothetical protein